MKVLFSGTPDFAVPSRQALLDAGHDITAVFTQPDKPKNRGMKLQAPPVKELAVAHGIPVYQPVKLRDGTAMEIIRQHNPELIVVAAYGRILPNDILDFPTCGCINVHSSLLPKYRGAAPIHWAILQGEEKSGVTIMHMAEELDAGDIISQSETPIDPMETVGELHDRLATMGAALLVQTVGSIQEGTATRTPQRVEEVTFAPMLNRELSKMDWSKSAQELHNQVRGLVPWPGAEAEIADRRVKVWKTSVAEGNSTLPVGTVLSADQQGIVIVCGGETLRCNKELQGQGKRRMEAADYLRGNPLLS